MKAVKLWVDDIRKAPDESWTWARTNDAAREILKAGRVIEASLDHDMGHHDRDPDDEDSIYLRGDSEDDGVQLVKWMIAYERVPSVVTIHSWNHVGAERMRQMLDGRCKSLTVQPYEVTKCANCHKRDGTVVWGDALAAIHGFTVKWCEICTLEAQIVHAEERAALLPELRDKLQIAKAKAKEI